MARGIPIYSGVRATCTGRRRDQRGGLRVHSGVHAGCTAALGMLRPSVMQWIAPPSETMPSAGTGTSVTSGSAACNA